MLTVAEEDRFVDTAPLGPFDIVASDGNTYQYDPDFFWRGADSDPEYPFIALGWDGRGEIRIERETINDIVTYSEGDNSTEVEYTKESPQTDTVTFHVAGIADYDDNDVAPQSRVGQIARELWRWVTGPGHSALNSVGSNGERPCLIIPEQTPTPSRLDDTYRVQFAAEIQHTMTWTEVVDAVAREEYTVNTE